MEVDVSDDLVVEYQKIIETFKEDEAIELEELGITQVETMNAEDLKVPAATVEELVKRFNFYARQYDWDDISKCIAKYICDTSDLNCLTYFPIEVFLTTAAYTHIGSFAKPEIVKIFCNKFSGNEISNCTWFMYGVVTLERMDVLEHFCIEDVGNNFVAVIYLLEECLLRGTDELLEKYLNFVVPLIKTGILRGRREDFTTRIVKFLALVLKSKAANERAIYIARAIDSLNSAT